MNDIGFCLKSLRNFSNFGSLKSTETRLRFDDAVEIENFSNFGSLKSTETFRPLFRVVKERLFQQFRLVEEH